MKTIAAMLASAIEHQQGGRLKEAESLYREILACDDRQSDAWHLLGTIAHQIGDAQAAFDLIEHAIELNPGNASYHCNLGNAQKGLGNLDAAEASYRMAILLRPDFPLAYFNLAALLKQRGQIEAAIVSYEMSLQQKPDFVEAQYNLSVIYHEQRNWSAAQAGYLRTLQVQGAHADAWNNLGMILKEQGQLSEAVECYRRAIQCRPDFAEALNNLGVACRDAREFNQALECYMQALRLKPDYAVAFNNLGNTLVSLRRPADAVTCLKRAIEIQPAFAEAYTNLGAALQELRRYHEAAESLRTALQLNPEDAAVLESLGNVSRDSGQAAEAIACYRRSLQLNPECQSTLGQLIHQLQHQCEWDDLPQLIEQAIRAVEHRSMENCGAAMSPFAFLTMHHATSSKQQQKCAAIWAADSARGAVRWNSTRETSIHHQRDERIRVGYLSADYRAHPVAELIVELFETHDRSRFAVSAYSYGPDDGSAMRQRMMEAFESFVDLRDASLAESVQRIAADEIDILVDLTGFTQHARPQVMASRPAPIQVNYLGYPGTMGADFIDYILVDEFIVPRDQQPYYHEKIVYLPGCYQANDTKRVIAETAWTRRDAGLPDQGFVFCSFNNNYKITPEIFSVWMRLLRRVPSSVLWLLESNQAAPGNLLREAERRGVSSDRIVFAPRMALPEHLARHRLADLFLDTFPVNAHTTASDALWAGLPVLTLSGETFISRVAGSLLKTLGVPELITTSLSDYQGRALELAQNPVELAALRERIWKNRRTSPLFDIHRSTRAIENAYVKMMEIYRSGQTPHSLNAVDASP